MTDTITVEGGALFGADLAGRTIRGLLLPWGKLSRRSPTTSPIAFERGTVRVPADVSIVSGNVDHSQFRPVARAVAVDDTVDGLVATFKVADGDEGDELFAAHAAGRLTKLSAELADIVRAGTTGLSAKLTGAAFTDAGAFEGAGLFTLAVEAAQADDALSDDDRIAALEKAFADLQDSLTSTDDQATEPAAAGTTEGQAADMGAAVAPDTLDQSAGATSKPVTKAEAFAIFRAMQEGTITPEQIDRLRPTLSAGENGVFSLNDVKYDGTGSVKPDERRPQWVDELWAGVGYQQALIPLLAHDNLTAKVVNGFKWTTKPAGGDWAGNKANIPSNQPATGPATTTASFWAMGHDHAIEHEIFNTPGYFESYFAAGAESYAKWADDKAQADALAAATDLVADNPSGLTIGAGWSALIDGATAVVLAGALPTFAIIAPALWKAMLKTPQVDILGYLTASLSLTEGDLAGFVLRPGAGITAGHILVGARNAMTVYELPGLIRVTAPDMVKGGIDTNMIGAEATLVNMPTALVDVAPFA